MGGFIQKIISFIMSFFQKSKTPDLDKKIEDNKKQIKEIDKKLKEEYDNVEESLKEWK